MSRSVTKSVYDRAKALQARGRLDLAMVSLERRLRHDDDGQLWELLGIVAFARDDLDRSQSALEEASIRVPLSPRGQITLARCYDNNGLRESAAAIYRHLATLVAVETELLESLAAGLGRYGECELALAVCREASRRMPECTAALMGIAHYMRRLRYDVQEVLPVMFQAHHLAPENCELRISLAWMLYETGLANDAAALLEPVPCAEFSCIRCLTLMQHIFDAVGNEEDADVCRHRLMVLAYERTADREEYPPSGAD
jgi:tetratricopeptide (TPR) repeat protein